MLFDTSQTQFIKTVRLVIAINMSILNHIHCNIASICYMYLPIVETYSSNSRSINVLFSG